MQTKVYLSFERKLSHMVTPRVEEGWVAANTDDVRGVSQRPGQYPCFYHTAEPKSREREKEREMRDKVNIIDIPYVT